ncbi:LOW QUALITY PROTEIN: hypothetical protein V1478_016988 [Vespula squamosa]|uniref:Uncharacterized protein n=1 Tax=Vespula squamosa TaxID=30214 RepID=A0ABD2A0I4_VESSQ
MDSGANLTVGGFGPRGALFSFFRPVGVGAATGATPAVDYREPLNIASDGCATGTTGTAATATATAAAAVAAAAVATAADADYDESERFRENRQDFESRWRLRTVRGRECFANGPERNFSSLPYSSLVYSSLLWSTLRFVSNQQRVGTSGSLKITITIYRYRRPGHVTNACLPTHWLLVYTTYNSLPLGAKDRRYPDIKIQ